MMDEGYDLARMATATLLCVLLVGAFVLVLSMMYGYLEEGSVNMESELQTLQKEDTSVTQEPITFDDYIYAVEPSTPEVITSFNNNFITHENPRVTFDETILNVKAQELFEEKMIQFYFITVDTLKKDAAEARQAAEKAQSRIKDDYKIVLTVTDSGSYWFYGDSVSSFLASEDKESVFAMFDGTFTVTPHVPFRLKTPVVCILLIGAFCLIGASLYWRYSIKKREVDAEILHTSLEKMQDEVDVLVDKYKEE